METYWERRRRQSKGFKYVCPRCKEKFRQKYNYKEHIKKCEK